jgi:putative hydrolase of the HAD superfamily
MAYEIAGIAAAFEVAATEHEKIHAAGLDLTAEGRTVLYLRHLDPEIGERLDEAGWKSMHEAVLTPALHVRPAMIAEAPDALAAIKGLGLPIGLISNAGTTPGFVLREILDGFGLLSHFDSTVFSDEVELAKPAAAIFERALDEFGVAPEEAAFVGDQPILDVLGPRAAGLWSIQVGALEEDGIEPHARISELSELVQALRELGLA